MDIGSRRSETGKRLEALTQSWHRLVSCHLVLDVANETSPCHMRVVIISHFLA
jgi:hypothetical protein